MTLGNSPEARRLPVRVSVSKTSFTDSFLSGNQNLESENVVPFASQQRVLHHSTAYGKGNGWKLQQVKQTLRRRMHEPVARVGEWLRRMFESF